MIFKITLINIKNSIMHNRSMYMLLFVSQLVAVNICFFVYGIYSSYSASLQEIDINSCFINANFVEGENVTVGTLRNCITNIVDEMEDEIDYFYIGLLDENTIISTYTEYHNGIFESSDTIAKNNVDITGRYLNDDDFVNENKVAYGTTAEIGETYFIGGEAFEVVGKDKDEVLRNRITIIPFVSAPNNLELMSMSIVFKNLPTKENYEKFKTVLEENFGYNVVLDEFPIRNTEELISIRTVIGISVVIGLIAALDTILLYSYIIEKRRKQMAIFSIVGAELRDRFAINEIEIMLISSVVSIGGFMLYKTIFEDITVKMAGVSVEIYNAKVYLIMLTVYLICVFVITYLGNWFNTRKNILEMFRRNANV